MRGKGRTPERKRWRNFSAKEPVEDDDDNDNADGMVRFTGREVTRLVESFLGLVGSSLSSSRGKSASHTGECVTKEPNQQ